MESANHPNATVAQLISDLQQVELEMIQGVEFIDQDIYVDGREFRDCLVRNCRLIIHLGLFRFVDSEVVDCTFEINWPAQGVVETLERIRTR